MFDETKGGGWNRVTEVLELTSERSEARVGKDREEEVMLAISILIYYRKSQQKISEVNTARNSIIRLLLALWILSQKKEKKRIGRQDLDEQGAIALVTNSAVVIWYLPMCMHYFD